MVNNLTSGRNPVSALRLVKLTPAQDAEVPSLVAINTAGAGAGSRNG